VLLQRGDALAADGRHRQDRRPGQRGAGQQPPDLGLGLGQAFGRHQVALAQRHHTALQAQQVQDRQVFLRLRHRTVVGCHHQHHMVDASGAGEHVAHQLLVAGHVDEAENVAVGQLLVGEAQVDGDAAFLLFLQSVGIDAGQRLHQRGLAVVDVSCGSYDHGGSRGCGAGSGPGIIRMRLGTAPRRLRQLVARWIGSTRLIQASQSGLMGQLCSTVHGVRPAGDRPMSQSPLPTINRRTAFSVRARSVRWPQRPPCCRAPRRPLRSPPTHRSRAPAGQGGGYRLTEHVKQYYATART
jgi:hypothetical protein